MKQLLIATTNPGKLEEITSILSDLPIKLVSLQDVNIKAKPDENGQTFEENAIIKAKFYAAISGLPTIGDDGGLEIDALGGEPGVKSHRWIHADREDEDEELIAYAIKKLKGVPLEDRGAHLKVVVAFVTSDGKIATSEGIIRGVIPIKPSITRVVGFPYRSLLYLPKICKFYNNDDLTREENEHYNHRRRALEALVPVIMKNI